MTINANSTWFVLLIAGLKAIYLSGWQVAADNNTSLQTYPDQSLYPVDSVPRVVSSGCVQLHS